MSATHSIKSSSFSNKSLRSQICSADFLIGLLVISLLIGMGVSQGTTGSIPIAYAYAGGVIALIAFVVGIVKCIKKPVPSKTSPSVIDPPSLPSPALITEEILSAPDDQVKVTRHQLVLDTTFTHREYDEWIARAPCHPKQKEMLAATVKKRPPQVGAVKPYIMIREKNPKILSSEMQSLLDQTISAFDYECVPTWSTYDEENHYYMDASHPKHFGGGFYTAGCVQEESMFWMISYLVHIYYAALRLKHSISLWEQDDQGQDIVGANSFIIEGVRREFIINPDIYGLALYRASQPVESYVKAERGPPINIIGMAALAYPENSRPYTKNELLYHFKTAFFGFQQVAKIERAKNRQAIINTLAWGCGAFRNSEKTITLLQLLAAGAAGVKIRFRGVDTDRRQLHYTTEFITKEVDNILKNRLTINQVLDSILQRQETDPTWKTKEQDPS